jgi:hypothetical protein
MNNHTDNAHMIHDNLHRKNIIAKNIDINILICRHENNFGKRFEILVGLDWSLRRFWSNEDSPSDVWNGYPGSLPLPNVAGFQGATSGLYVFVLLVIFSPWATRSDPQSSNSSMSAIWQKISLSRAKLPLAPADWQMPPEWIARPSPEARPK